MKSTPAQVNGVAEHLKALEQRTDARSKKAMNASANLSSALPNASTKQTGASSVFELMQAGFERLDRRLDVYNDVQAMKTEIAALKAQRNLPPDKLPPAPVPELNAARYRILIKHMNLFLALDVGGTKSAAVLADDRQILARATAGSIKTLRIPPEEAAANLKTLQAALEAQAGVPLGGNIVRTCVGTSGISVPTVRHWLREAFAQAVGGEFVLLGDEVIALDAAFAGRRGVLAIAGTGSNIVGRANTGEMAHTGGWGPALADEGSGHWIGAEALRACFRTLDAAPPSSADAVSAIGNPIAVSHNDLPPLLRAILSALKLPGLDSIIGTANAPGFNSSALVPTVVEAAAAGDQPAQSVLRRAGEDLAGLITAVIRKVEHFEQISGSNRAEPRLSAPPVAFVGGVLTQIGPVREAMQASLRAAFGEIELAEKPVDPLDGALWHARGRPALAS